MASPRARRMAGGEYLQKILTARVYDVAAGKSAHNWPTDSPGAA